MSRSMNDQLLRYLLASQHIVGRTSPEGIGRKFLITVPAIPFLMPLALPFYALIMPLYLVKMGGRKMIALGYCLSSIVSIGGLFANAALFGPFVGLFFIGYITCWVHINLQLSRIRAAARAVVERIDKSDVLRQDATEMLGKAALLYKVLGDKQEAERVLEACMRLDNGDPRLLHFAGLVMAKRKKPAAAVEWFRRALATAKDQDLIAEIRRDLAASASESLPTRGVEPQPPVRM